MPYISARGIQNRLDEIFGVDGWSPEYTVVPEMGVICTLRCSFDGGEITKSDGAEFTQVSPLKGGFSGALKRTASVLGIGRYLYNLPEVTVSLKNKRFRGKIVLPDEFLPENERTGNAEIKIEYEGGDDSHREGRGFESHDKYSPREGRGELTDEVKAAMEYVIEDGSFNNGKKMGEVSLKSLSYMASRGKSEELKAAAKIVLDYKS